MAAPPIPPRVDGVVMHRVVGTSDGRIFCAGRDGCVHEVVYDSLTPAAVAGPPGTTPSITDSVLSGGLVEGVMRAGTWVTDALGFPVPALKRAKKVNHSVTTVGCVDGG